MNCSLLGTVSGFIVCVAVVFVTIFRQRRFASSDIGTFAAAFLAANNIPAAMFLCTYAFSPDPPTVATKLHDLETFVSFAGLALLLVSLVAIWSMCAKAWTRQ